MILSLSFADKLLVEKGLVLVLLERINFFKQSAYTYLICSSDDIIRMQKDTQQQGIVDYNHYGQLVLAGMGTPSKETAERAIEMAKQKLADA